MRIPLVALHMHVAIVGATGLVGRTMLRVLEERQTPIDKLTLLASERSAGQTVEFRGLDIPVQVLGKDSFVGQHVALFSAGGSVSREYAPIAAAAGCTVVDNSSAWRMDASVPLVVPEVNAADALQHNGIIANPNCSTIQLVVALKPLADEFGIKRVIASTYQSVTGAGQQGLDHLHDELAGRTPAHRISPHPIAYNTVFHSFSNNDDSSEEEIKMMRETKRIMHLPDLPIAVTCVRVPIVGGHGESVAVELDRHADVDEVRSVLRASPGVVVVDDPANNAYPTAASIQHSDLVSIGRIRRDPSIENGILMWVVADNLRKGAATNAVQILEVLSQ